MEQSRISTLSAGRMVRGGFAGVLVRKRLDEEIGVFLGDLRGHRVHALNERPGCRPSCLSIAAHVSHWHAPCQSFWLMEMMPADGFLRMRFERFARAVPCTSRGLVQQSWPPSGIPLAVALAVPVGMLPRSTWLAGADRRTCGTNPGCCSGRPACSGIV